MVRLHPECHGSLRHMHYADKDTSTSCADYGVPRLFTANAIDVLTAMKCLQPVIADPVLTIALSKM
jgi:hypothetical protein